MENKEPKLLLIDVKNLLWRAIHALPIHNKNRIDVGRSFYNTLNSLLQRFHMFVPVFCFDSQASKRRELYPLYKAGRVDNNDIVSMAMACTVNLVSLYLQKHSLPVNGFRNCFELEGYEADDIIAWFAHHGQHFKTNVIVSNDNDLLQCIRPNCAVFNLKNRTIMKWSNFIEAKRKPSDIWGQKAIGGCQSDNVPHVKDGVGQVTALEVNDMLDGKTLPKTPSNLAKAVYGAITRRENPVWDAYCRNVRLVKLPWNNGKDMPNLLKKLDLTPKEPLYQILK